MFVKNLSLVILFDRNGKILLQDRKSMSKHGEEWGYFGGKIDSGESPEEAIVREIKEELGCEINITKEIKSFTYKYPDKTIVLKPFICRIKNNLPKAIEHEKIEWLSLDELNLKKWLAADVEIKNYIQTFYS